MSMGQERKRHLERLRRVFLDETPIAWEGRNDDGSMEIHRYIVKNAGKVKTFLAVYKELNGSEDVFARICETTCSLDKPPPAYNTKYCTTSITNGYIIKDKNCSEGTYDNMEQAEGRLLELAGYRIRGKVTPSQTARMSPNQRTKPKLSPREVEELCRKYGIDWHVPKL